jgi:hypothetical protein
LTGGNPVNAVVRQQEAHSQSNEAPSRGGATPIIIAEFGHEDMTPMKSLMKVFAGALGSVVATAVLAADPPSIPTGAPASAPIPSLRGVPNVAQEPVANAIAPGMTIAEARAILRRHGHDEEVPMAILSRNAAVALETCRIDANVVLVLGFEKTTGRVVDTSLCIEANDPTSRGQSVWRKIRGIAFEANGEYSVRLVRVTRDQILEEEERSKKNWSVPTQKDFQQPSPAEAPQLQPDGPPPLSPAPTLDWGKAAK